MDKTELVDKVDKAIENYSGNISHLCTAIGIMFLARSLGWRAVRLMFSNKTYGTSQKILDMEFKDHFLEEGRLARKSVVLDIVKKFHNFWNVVNGVESLVEQKEKKRELRV
jgi:hypothetical protein